MLDKLPERARVAVIRLRSLGDCVLTTPALEVLKRSRPDLKIAVIVEDRFASVFDGNPDVELALPPVTGLLRWWRPHLCLNLHGGTRSLLMAFRSGAPYSAGFAHYRYSFLYNIRIPTAQEILGVDRKVHTAEHLASAMFYLGAARCEIPPAKLFSQPPADAPPYAVMHPFASAPDKTWPAANFLEVAEGLRRDRGLEPVFIGGARDNFAPFRGHRTLAGAPLAEVMSLIAGAAAFVGNDSGPAHVAAAFQVPSVVNFGASDPDLWSPWKSPRSAIVTDSPPATHNPQPTTVLNALSRLMKVPA